MFSWFSFWSSEVVSQPAQAPSVPEGSESAAKAPEAAAENSAVVEATVEAVVEAPVEAVVDTPAEPAVESVAEPVASTVNTVSKDAQPLADSAEAVKILDELIAELFDLSQSHGQTYGPARNAPNNGIGIKHILNQAPTLVMRQTTSEINNVRSKLRPTKINADPAARIQRPGMAELDRIFCEGVMTYLQKTKKTT